MKQKRDTPRRTGRTFSQAVVGTVVSWGLVESVVQQAFPLFQQGEYQTAAVAALAVVLTALSSTAQNWLDNRRPERRDAPVEN